MERGVAHPFHVIGPHVGQEADGDGVLDVDRIGEAAGQKHAVDLLSVTPSRRSRMRWPAASEALAWASWLASAREKMMSGSAAIG